MFDIESMSTGDLLSAIEFYEETGDNLTLHGQADDYLVGSQKMASIYKAELDRRTKGENKQ